MKHVRIKVGDVIEIPLANGRKAYGQYVYMDKKMGPLLQVFDIVTRERVNVEQLKRARPLFPPVFTGLYAAIRAGFWRVIGHMPIEDFTYPKFVSTLWNEKTGQAGVWFLWDGERDIRIGNELPGEYRNLEFLVGWDPHTVVQRIETGEYPYPYGDLILHNSFKPRN